MSRIPPDPVPTCSRRLAFGRVLRAPPGYSPAAHQRHGQHSRRTFTARRRSRGQTRETFHNLAALLAASDASPARRPLEALRSLRVHVREAADAPAVRALVDELAPHVTDVELVQAPLCRRELLVEIEGVAEC